MDMEVTEIIIKNKWIVCRICLKNVTQMQKTFNIFDAETVVTNLIDKIQACGGILLDKDDDLPDSMCSKCILLLRISYKFRDLCQRSQQQLMNLLDPKKEHMISEQYVQYEDIIDQNEEGERISPLVKQELDSFPDSEPMFIREENVDSDIQTEVQTEDELIEEVECDFELQNEQEEYLQDESSQNFENVELTYLPSEPSTDNVFSFEDSQELEIETVAVDTVQQDNIQQVIDPNSNSKNVSSRSVLNNVKKTSLQPQTSSELYIITEFSASKAAPSRRKPKTKQPTVNSKVLKLDEGDDNPSFICSHCGNIYTEKAKLTLHMKIHTKLKPHECEICFKRFAQTPQLARHMNSHTGSRPFKCKFCSASFADPSTRIKHQRIHTNERPYTCTICNKSFSYSNVLKVHFMTHTGEKPFSCEHCGKKFAQLHHKKAHVRTHSYGSMLFKIGSEESQDNLE